MGNRQRERAHMPSEHNLTTTEAAYNVHHAAQLLPTTCSAAMRAGTVAARF